MTKIEAKFGQMSHHDRRQLHDKLLVAYNPPYSLLTFELDHREVHRRLHADGQPLSEFDKFNYYADALKPCGIFTEAIKNYLRNFPQPDFDSFCSAMAAEAELCGPNITAATAGYSSGGSALVAASRQHIPTMEELTALIASTVSKALDQRDKERRQLQRNKKKQQRKQQQAGTDKASTA